MRIEACVSDIDRWMLQNLLKLNRSKTELLILNAEHRPSPPIAAVTIGDAVINPSKTAQNIGAVCDSSLFMEEHVKASCKSAVFHLTNIAQIWKHLLAHTAETLLHSLLTSKVDFCNSLLYGVPNQLIWKLQNVQNSVARLLTYTNKQEHIKLVLKQPHWLPLSSGCNIKSYWRPLNVSMTLLLIILNILSTCTHQTAVWDEKLEKLLSTSAIPSEKLWSQNLFSCSTHSLECSPR